MATADSPKKTRWLRRLSYAIAGGAAVGAVGVWFAHSAPMQKAYIRLIASAIKDETGLDFDATGLGFSLFRGRASLYRPSLDTDFFAADEIEVVADLWSLLGDTPHIKRVLIVNPTSNISAARFDRIKTKQSDGPALNWRLDTLELRNGRLSIQEPKWGLPSLEVTFSAHGKGGSPRKLDAEFDCPSIAIANETGSLRGTSKFLASIDSDVVSLKALSLDSDLLKLKANGAFDTAKDAIACEANGAILAHQLVECLGNDYSGFKGQVDFKASISGSAAAPMWNLHASAPDLTTPYPLTGNCTIALDASGGSTGVEIEQFKLMSNGAALAVKGHIKDDGCNLVIDGTALPLKSLSDMAKTPLLGSVVADVKGQFSSPLPIWDSGALGKSKLDIGAVFHQGGSAAGGFVAAFNEGSLQIKSFDLNVPDLKISANGAANCTFHTRETETLGFDLASMTVTADIATTAEQVAFTLDKWKVVDNLPISGKVHAKAHTALSSSAGLSLAGTVKVANPVYSGVSADVLETDVRIASEQLFLDNLHADRVGTKAGGRLWLTWADVPRGAEQISMRYEASGLPFADGLAAGIDDKKILEDMAATGTANGWVSIAGTYDAMKLMGEAKLRDGSIYGVSVPAFAASVEMNLDDRDLCIKIPEFRLADSMANLESMAGTLALKGSLDIDVDKETWMGSVTGAVDSHALGMLDAPRITARVESALQGALAAQYGPLVLPEAQIAFSEGGISFKGNSVEGLSGNLSLGGGLLYGKAGFRDFQSGGNALVEINANRDRSARTGDDVLRWQFRADFSPETADTKALAQTLTGGVLGDINMSLSANGRVDARGISGNADVSRLSGRLYGLEFDQQSFGTLQGTPESVKLAFDIGVYEDFLETLTPISWVRVNGTLPLDKAGTVDLRLTGTADLEQVLQMLAGLSGESQDAVLSGFTPVGVGSIDLNVRGPYSDLGLGGAMQIRGGQLVPRDNFPYGIENLNMDMIFRGHKIALENLSGRMARGTLMANGEAMWNYKGIDTYRLRTKLDNFYYYFVPDGLHLSGSLDAIYQSLPKGKSEIMGTLSATSVTYAKEIDFRGLILDASPKSIPGLQSVELNDPLDSINLNLDVDLSQPWVVDTNLLKFKGIAADKFKIMGTLANPGLRGRMDFMPGGRITNILPAGDVIIEKGSIDFPDPSVFNPVIDLQGQIDVSPYRVNINIQGPLDSINLVPTSTPSLRQDDVIAILLNPALAPSIDSAIDSLSSNRLSSQMAASSWTSAAGGLITNLWLTPVQEQFRRALKLDRVSMAVRPGLDSESTTEYDIIVGKNLAFGERSVPLMGIYRRSGDYVTLGGEAEWRMGNLVVRFGASADAVGLTPSGEIRYSWSLR